MKKFITILCLLFVTPVFSQIPSDYGNPIYSCVLSAKHDFALYLLPSWIYGSSHVDSLWYTTNPGIRININHRNILNGGYDGLCYLNVYDDSTLTVDALTLVSRIDILNFCLTGDVFANGKDTLISGTPAKYFYYIKTATVLNVTTKTQTKTWHFRYKNRTYTLEFRDPTPADWTQNNNFYDLYLSSILFLPIGTSSKPLSKSIENRPILKQFYNINELLNSDLMKKASSFYLYDLQGRLIMNLEAFKKYNKSNANLSKGFYVSNIKVENEATRSILISNQK